MGNSLHEKIYLGRRNVVLHSKRAQAVLGLCAVASVGLVWLAIRALK